MRIAEIRIYPVKGLRGHAVAAAEVEPWGLADDRRFMVVDPDGGFLTQRQIPLMAMIVPELMTGGLALSAPGSGPIAVAKPDGAAPRLDVTIWRDRVPALDCGSAAAAWLTAALGRPCRLVHMADPSVRPIDPDFSDPADRVSFADGFPLLVTTTASLADLNRRLADPIAMDRFRPNVVVEGAQAWAEDGWQRLALGAASFAGTKDCARCAVVTVDQATGERSGENEPLKTMAGFRRKAQGRIIFGQNLIPRRLGRIALGDAVSVG